MSVTEAPRPPPVNTIEAVTETEGFWRRHAERERDGDLVIFKRVKQRMNASVFLERERDGFLESDEQGREEKGKE